MCHYNAGLTCIMNVGHRTYLKCYLDINTVRGHLVSLELCSKTTITGTSTVTVLPSNTATKHFSAEQTYWTIRQMDKVLFDYHCSEQCISADKWPPAYTSTPAL